MKQYRVEMQLDGEWRPAMLPNGHMIRQDFGTLEEAENKREELSKKWNEALRVKYFAEAFRVSSREVVVTEWQPE